MQNYGDCDDFADLRDVVVIGFTVIAGKLSALLPGDTLTATAEKEEEKEAFSMSSNLSR